MHACPAVVSAGKPIARSTNRLQGVEWIDEHRLMFASDRAKAKQPFICTTRDQGVHVSRYQAGCQAPEIRFTSSVIIFTCLSLPDVLKC